jgi:hypothetical protein
VGLVHISDPAWPADPGWDRRILVSLSYQVAGAGRPGFQEPQVWWLQLGEDGLSIEGAGRLTVADAAEDRAATAHERLPNLATTPDRGLALAYLTSTDRRYWNLRIVPVEIEEGTGIPRVRTSIVPRVAESCLPTAPTFSPDGRWVYGVLRARGSGPRLSRFSVVETLAALQAPRLSRLDRPEVVADGPLNGATPGVQLSGHLARRTEIAREAGRHDSPRPVARRADGLRGLPDRDDRPDVAGGRDARGG